jgi:hypothetical protein
MDYRAAWCAPCKASLFMPHRFLAIAFLFGVAACGGDDLPPPDCSGASCSCPADTACGFDSNTCGDGGSCSLDCGEGADCSGSCSESCSIDCSPGASCTVTVGASGSVSCEAGSTCHVTCTDSCSVSCAADATCDLRCAGDAEPHPIEEGGSCP